MSSIGPYTSIAGFTPSLARALQKSQDSLDDLSMQYASGKISQSYAGLGAGRSTSLAMRAALSSIASYQQTAATVTTRVNLMNASVTRLNDLAGEYATIDSGGFQLTSSGLTVAQSQAETDLTDAIAQLNNQVGGRYLFSGRSTTTKPVLTADQIMADSGSKSGLRTVIDQRKLADVGANGLGRINVSGVTGSTFNVTEQASGPFGFKISSLNSTLSNGVANGPTATPPSVTLGLTGQPTAGGQTKVGVQLPDGSAQTITLTAVAAYSTPPVSGEFLLGATPEDTATNMQTAFGDALGALGVAGNGGIQVSTSDDGLSFKVSEQASGDGGVKLTSANSTLDTGVATGPTAAIPPSITLGLTGQPLAGENVRVGLTLPDGSTEEIKLTAIAATSTSEPQAGEFRIGATQEETAQNMQAAFGASLRKLADTSLVAASAIQAGNEFFDSPAAGQGPGRVGGFDGTYATDADRVAALQNATSLDTSDTTDKTVAWYQGDNSSSDARKTAAATISDGVSVSYGAQANENGLRDVVKSLAVFSSMTFSSSDTNANERYAALTNRISSNLGSAETTKAIQTISADLSTTTTSIKSAGDRATAAKAMAEDTLSDVEDADKTEVAVKLSALQSQLEASYSIVAALKDLSLVNFL
ncbi:flagellin [Hansschlegelia quercus]|uniref:Uncharacterized protein n=1 Tax=Hansschlegelia quercus TaxID=2528245 RepID=A0A4Q9GSC4_9HYPH|nr:flagellin [Hansschlegelia quercus]TBN55070.1 hypothetical protein EYR15_02710 [Hansschlegelia quercus]